MSSLDETCEALTFFGRAFSEFNESLRVSAADLADKHAKLDGLWTDSAARAYGQFYEPLETSLRGYLGRDAPQMEEFINNKIRLLNAYLMGN